MAQNQKKESNSDNQSNQPNQRGTQSHEGITSKSGEVANQVNEAQEVQSQHGREPGLRSVGRESQEQNRHSEKNMSSETNESDEETPSATFKTRVLTKIPALNHVRNDKKRRGITRAVSI